jgi:hypothetical protein
MLDKAVHAHKRGEMRCDVNPGRLRAIRSTTTDYLVSIANESEGILKIFSMFRRNDKSVR